MTKSIHWRKVQSLSLPNLFVLMDGEKELGFITKPKDTRFDKNAWRCHSGIGENTSFLGHEYNKGMAMRQVEKTCGVHKPSVAEQPVMAGGTTSRFLKGKLTVNDLCHL
jgi:hypothetical protein